MMWEQFWSPSVIHGFWRKWFNNRTFKQSNFYNQSALCFHYLGQCIWDGWGYLFKQANICECFALVQRSIAEATLTKAAACKKHWATPDCYITLTFWPKSTHILTAPQRHRKQSVLQVSCKIKVCAYPGHVYIRVLSVCGQWNPMLLCTRSTFYVHVYIHLRECAFCSICIL